MRNIVGKAVRGRNFFNRPEIVKKIWYAVESGSHLLLAAPRRVGKTSLLFYLEDHPKAHYHVIYVVTESVTNENEYFKRLFQQLINSEFISMKIKTSHTLCDSFQQVSNKIKSLKILGTHLEFHENAESQYEQEFRELLKSLPLGDDKVLIMVDEFPQAIQNIIHHEGEQDAIQFLQSNRELRQDPALSANMQFLYTGSIGLENVVSTLEAMHLINDLDCITVTPLSRGDARLFLRLLAKDLAIALDPPLIDYILDEIEWFTPYHLQIALKALANMNFEREVSPFTPAMIDHAFDVMLFERRNYFAHWQLRLRRTFPGASCELAEALLNLISQEKAVTSSRIRSLAEQYSLARDYKYVVNTLVYDGYINNNDEPTIYRFNSPLLRRWWYKYVAN